MLFQNCIRYHSHTCILDRLGNSSYKLYDDHLKLSCIQLFIVVLDSRYANIAPDAWPDARALPNCATDGRRHCVA